MQWLLRLSEVVSSIDAEKMFALTLFCIVMFIVLITVFGFSVWLVLRLIYAIRSMRWDSKARQEWPIIKKQLSQIKPTISVAFLGPDESTHLKSNIISVLSQCGANLPYLNEEENQGAFRLGNRSNLLKTNDSENSSPNLLLLLTGSYDDQTKIRKVDWQLLDKDGVVTAGSNWGGIEHAEWCAWRVAERIALALQNSDGK
ncbi:MAG: hypothetical protein WC508_04875 [Patescibacteria group bacterium]